jgi:capsule polysaccharide modification protein KpsS
MPRSFIDETIQTLKKSADKIQQDWEKFQKGELSKEQFEEGYYHVLAGWLDVVNDEKHLPNNGCKYMDTNPECKNFVEQQI